MLTTLSEQARHARAELEAIIAALRLDELACLLQIGRRLLEEGNQRPSTTPEGLIGPFPVSQPHSGS